MNELEQCGMHPQYPSEYNVTTAKGFKLHSSQIITSNSHDTRISKQKIPFEYPFKYYVKLRVQSMGLQYKGIHTVQSTAIHSILHFNYIIIPSRTILYTLQ